MAESQTGLFDSINCLLWEELQGAQVLMRAARKAEKRYSGITYALMGLNEVVDRVVVLLKACFQDRKQRGQCRSVHWVDKAITTSPEGNVALDKTDGHTVIGGTERLKNEELFPA